jgi:serine O-acetyltransferase
VASSTGRGRPDGTTWVRRGAFATDLEKYESIALEGKRGLAGRVRLWLLSSELHCVASFRFAQAARDLYVRNRLLGLLPLLVSALWRHHVSTVHHTNLDRRAHIGPGFFIMHRNGLFVGPVGIGANCVLHHNVTIGQRVAARDRGLPTLGDNVWVGPGATISGDITIGDNVTIAAGTVLSKSVPDGALVAGNPGRIIQNAYDNRSMINFTMPAPEVRLRQV